MEEKKQSIWFREVNVIFVYAVIFLVGLLIVFLMTNYINSKVEEFDQITTNSSTY